MPIAIIFSLKDFISALFCIFAPALCITKNNKPIIFNQITITHYGNIL